MKTPRLIPVADRAALLAAGITISYDRLRHLKCEGWKPRVFVKVAGRLHIDLDAWERDVTRPALAERDARAEKIEQALGKGRRTA